MENNIIIKNERNIFSIFLSQYGQIAGIETAILISYFFVEFNIVLSVQLIVIPIVIVLIASKFNKPTKRVTIDKNGKSFIFIIAVFFNINRAIAIPFDNIVINRRWKFLLNYYQEVLEIKNGTDLKIVIPFIKANTEFINSFLQVLGNLKKSNYIW